MKEKILAAAREYLKDCGFAEISETSQVQDVSMDSLDHVELVMTIEEACQIEIADEWLERIKPVETFDELAERAERELKDGVLK